MLCRAVICGHRATVSGVEIMHLRDLSSSPQRHHRVDCLCMREQLRHARALNRSLAAGGHVREHVALLDARVELHPRNLAGGAESGVTDLSHCTSMFQTPARA